MPHAFKDVEVVRRGDAQGNHMVLRLTTRQGASINAIAVPQDQPSGTGPTWTFLFEHDGLTLIDAGATGSFSRLVEGIECAGFHAKDIERVVITHGHADHDGAAARLVGEADAELWAHDIYAHLLTYDPWEIQQRDGSPIHRQMERVADANTDRRRTDSFRLKHQSYLHDRMGLEVKRRIRAGDRFGNMTFLHAPGHSVDEICVTLDGLVFTGDHVLPEITPHPTTKAAIADDIKRRLPAEYHDEDGLYGLETYLRSLKKVHDLGPDTTVMPAHRLFNKGRFNFQSVRRAGEVIQHHSMRLRRILDRIRSGPTGLEELTRGLFERRKLIGGNLYMALSEVVAHLELLQDAGDVEVTEEQKLRRTGSENYRQLIHELSS